MLIVAIFITLFFLENAPELIVSGHTQRTSVNPDFDLFPAAGMIYNRKSKPGLFCSGTAKRCTYRADY